MAKQDYLFRYLSIIRKLRRSGEATFKEISGFLAAEAGYHDRPFSISARTFQRDVNEIRELFGIDIRFDFSKQVYYIASDSNNDMNNRMLESVDTLNSLRMAGDLGRYMHFEKRQSLGTQHFQGLLHAIRNRIVISLIHQKYDFDEPTRRNVHPYALKESGNRWYLLARDSQDHRLKTFGLDRIIDFSETPKRFDYPRDLDINRMFRNCFGVINPDEGQPQEIILSFDPEQGKYIQSYPIHESQTVLIDNAHELRIRLYLYITHDLRMELLSYGDRVKVHAPQSLANDLAEIYKRAWKQYGKK